MAKNKPGPPSKGERTALHTRWLADDRAFIKSEADRLGIAEGSFVVKQFLESLNRPLPQYLIDEIRRGEALGRARQEQEELPLPRTA